MIDSKDTDLLRPGTLVEFCEAYADAEKSVDEAFRILETTYQRMSTLVHRFNLIPQNLHDFDLKEKSGAKKAKAEMQRSAWHEIVRRTGVTDVMLERERKKLTDSIDRADVPPLNMERIGQLISGIRGDLGKIIQDAINEAARVLRPHNSEYKTNGDGWELGEKAIMNYGVSYCKWSGMNLSYHCDSSVNAIDNAFHLLDGKGVSAHPDTLAMGIRTAMRAKLQSCETEYFVCKWFKKGTLHFVFKRMDLVAELNRRTTDNTLRRPTETALAVA